ncbi:MAG TPA: valine--tRNA ligase [Candidatus Paceibacterota bacterium]|nr:valine--tRNA ligase [Candidatus Paceibacterota bacterium]
MIDRMESRYDIKEVEARIYKMWEESGLFNPDVCVEKGVTKKDAEAFSVVLPPPNVTGTLHLGHAYEDTFQDIIVRFERMRGKKTLWVPGTDHAAIATQAKVEKELQKKEKKSRFDLGREEFLKRVNAFAKESHDTIVRQVRRMGASLDWSREAYTLDEKRNRAVVAAFAKMHELGLIYRGNRVVNWDPKGQTVISDDEIVYEERKAKFYTFRYSKDFPIAISTTRLETKVGDTAVAVHPSDPRYKKFVGKEYDVDFCGTPLHIKVIADEAVEKEFGTGALGVTPAHSMIDWEMAQKHKLPLIQVIDEHARMTIAGPLKGMKTTEAREWVAEELRKRGLLEKEEEIPQNVSTSERTGGIIEPLPKLQWFVNVDSKFEIQNSKLQGIKSGAKITLKELMRKVVESGQIKIMPERFEKVYLHWIDNLRDWCISRQIWFGHRIPVWYKGGEIHVGGAPQGNGWEEDPDTFDTWFSSGTWTFSTLGWPDETPDLKAFHPTSFMGPGYEILFLWVARMILMSTSLLGDIPFRTVALHGIVRDSKGQKFSKSAGNGIDPLLLADQYGADAIRMALIAGTALGNDVKFDEQKVKGYRNFSTKIWNIARFVLLNRPADVRGSNKSVEADPRGYVAALQELKKEVTAHIEHFEFHLAAEKLYHYIWHTLADKIVEEEKAKLKDGSEEEKAASYALLEHLLLESLTMLHPFMPFVTEEIYGIFTPGKMLMVERW